MTEFRLTSGQETSFAAFRRVMPVQTALRAAQRGSHTSAGGKRLLKQFRDIHQFIRAGDRRRRGPGREPTAATKDRASEILRNRMRARRIGFNRKLQRVMRVGVLQPADYDAYETFVSPRG